MTKNSELNFAAIYTITHIASGKTYVGQTINVRVRWQLHRSDLRKGKHRNAYLQYAWNKYGKDAFTFSIHTDLRNIPSERLALELNQMEVAILASFPETYNLMHAGESGVVASPETRALLSKQRLIMWQDPAHRAKHREALLALNADLEWKAARDAAVKEGKNTEHHKAAVSAQMTELWKDNDHRSKQSWARKANWEDPAYREQQSTSRSASWANPEIRERRMAGLLIAAASPEVLAARKAGQQKSLHKMAAATKSRWEDPVQRARIIDAQNAGRARAKAAKANP